MSMNWFDSAVNHKSKPILWAVVVMFLIVALPAGAQQTTLTIAIQWDETVHLSSGFVAAARAFEELNPDVTIEFIPGAGWSDNINHPQSAKLMTMVAGGLSPDLAMVGGQVVPQYAHLDLLMPLDKYIEASGVRQQDFIPAAWDQAGWLGQQYAMTVFVDPNFAMVWHTDLFAEAGLREDRAPETLSEYEEYFRRLTRMGDDGRLSQIGNIPWDVYGAYNTVFTWGWIFGGEFYDYENNRVTASDPSIVQALEFLRDYHDEYDHIQPAATSVALFPAQREAMRFAVSGDFREWRNNYPDNPMGSGLMPYVDGGTPNPSWIGGWAMGILPDAPNPDLAWEFLHFLTATPEGTEVFGEVSGWIPAYLPSPVHQIFLDDPVLLVYLDIAQTARNRRPGMPVIVDYATYLEEAFFDVLHGDVQPLDALQFVETVVQSLLDEVLAE